MAVAVAKMHAVALAIAPHLAVGTWASLHPFPVAIYLKLVLPHLPEAVLVNVALVVVVTDAQAARYGAIGQHRSDVDARTARIVVVAHFALIFTEKAVAAIVGTDLAFQPGLTDELHHHHKLLVAELEVGFVGGSTERKHRKQTPATYAQ